MKIRSITDVITNSSTEVFLLETDKSLEEVIKILPTITEGYMPPEVLEKGVGPLERIYEFGELYDPSKKSDVQKYMYQILGMSDFHWSYYREDSKPEDFVEMQNLWKEYVHSHIDYINEEISKRDKYFHSFCDCFRDYYEELGYWWYSRNIPLEFLDNFLKDIWGKPLPEVLKIPTQETLDYWVGKIGFSETGDNSIPFETWEKIYKTFGGTHYHLG